jgi:phage shock protein C
MEAADLATWHTIGWACNRNRTSDDTIGTVSMSTWQNLRGATKSSNDRWIKGVCGGLGAATSIPSWMWRVAFIFLAFAYFAGLILYVALWLCMPMNKGDTEPRTVPAGGPSTSGGQAGAAEGPSSVS